MDKKDRFVRYLLSLVRLQQTVTYKGSQEQLLSMMNELVKGHSFGQDLKCIQLKDGTYAVEPKDNAPLEMAGPGFYFAQDARVKLVVIRKEEQVQLLRFTGRIRPVIKGLFAFYLTFLCHRKFISENGLTPGSFIAGTVVWLMAHALINYFWSQKEKELVHSFKKAILVMMQMERQGLK